jgi:hypothetical protein
MEPNPRGQNQTPRPDFGLSMLDIGIAPGLALAGFALGYGTREIVSYRRRQAARERYRQLGLVD